MLLGQELKFKNKLCNLKLGTFFSALPGLGASALSGRMGQTVTGRAGRIFLERVRESDRHEFLKLPITITILTLRTIVETRIEEDIR